MKIEEERIEAEKKRVTDTTCVFFSSFPTLFVCFVGHKLDVKCHFLLVFCVNLLRIMII